MKVTVTFGRTGVVVPCREGWTVRDLIQQATQRYRKILEQEGDFLVRTHHMEYCDGGILDPDDVLTDLVEDKDKLIAVYEEQEAQQRAAVSPGGGSATGRPSPDPYDTERSFQPIRGGEIEVTSTVLKSNTPLMVRSSSDPALSPPVETGPPQSEELNGRPTPTGLNQALAEVGEEARHRADGPTAKMSHVTLCKLTKMVEISGEKGPLGIHVVPYCSSLSGRALGLHIRGVEENSRSQREGIFQNDECIVRINDAELIDKSFAQSQEVFRQAMRSPTVLLEVVPIYNKDRYEKSLISQLFSPDLTSSHDPGPRVRAPAPLKVRTEAKAVEPPARAFEPPSRAFEPPARAAEPSSRAFEPSSRGAEPSSRAFEPSSRAAEPSSRALEPQSRAFEPSSRTFEPPARAAEPPSRAFDPPSRAFDPPSRAFDPPSRAVGPPSRTFEPPSRAFEPEPAARVPEAQGAHRPDGRASASPPPTGLPATPRGRSDSPLLRQSPALSPLLGLANRKGGKRLKIDLKKGQEGLGFTVVTRDSSVHGPGPILVKNILPRGAAVKDGRLQSGDRILEVKGVDITGRTQEELVAMLRSTKQGETVSLVVARQEEMFLPRELKGEQASALLLEEGKEQLMFEVPLNDSGSAGLGVSLKGNRSRETGEDLGIFIKSIIHGGAAYKDGRLRVNDQLIAVNGESLLAKSNHEAMETLRRSMSMEGNVRGMIQLVLVRPLDRVGQENHEPVAPQGRSADQAPLSSSVNGPAQPTMLANSIYERSAAPEMVPNGRYDHTDGEEDEEEFPLPPSHLPPPVRSDPGPGPPRAHTQSPPPEPEPHPVRSLHPDRPQPRQLEHHHVKSSKSMDLVADESNVGSLAVQKSEAPQGRELGPTLGLKKSSSLESLQTAVSEVRKNELPFHRPRPHMVRGRGCNESFRAAIDKSYDGPPEMDDDDLSDPSSGRDTPASGSSRQGLGDAEESKKDKKKKGKGKKKEKKSKGKEKDKKKVEDGEEQDKKTKKKGFALLRFGKKKEDKAKAALQKQKSEVLSEEELDRMKEERERIEAKHQELRDHQARERLPLPDVEDDDHDPNYARINNFREPPPAGPYPPRDRSPSPQLPVPPASHSQEPSSEGPIEGLYAKVNKQRAPPMPAADSSDRIQLLRREYQQARREGAAPSYEELEARRQAQDYDPHRMAMRGHDGRMAPRYEDVERQYASLPRRGPMDPNDYPMQPWGGHREPAHYPAPQPGYPSYPSRDNYPRAPDRRQGDPDYYPPPPQHRGPLRQDVPPSPTLPLRAPRYDTMNRGGYRSASPERYAYGEGRNPDPRQTAAV